MFVSRPQTITCYDSLEGQPPQELMEKLLIWLKDEYTEAGLAHDPATWRMVTTRNTPQQVPGARSLPPRLMHSRAIEGVEY